MNVIFEIYKTLLKKFGKQGWWPTTKANSLIPVYDKNFPKKRRTEREKLEIAIGAILTQNTTWKNVEKAIKNLKKNGLLNRKKLKEISVEELANYIRSSGYFKQKAKKIKAYIEFKGKVTRKNLLKIWGVGEETADSILLYAYNKPIFVIDAYTKRILSRIGFNAKTYEEFQNIFHNNLRRNHIIFNEYHALLVKLAKEYCKKNNPLCKKCPILKFCNYGKSKV